MLFGLVSRHYLVYISSSILSILSMVKFLRQHRTNDVPVTGTISPRYIHQFSHKSIRVTAKGSAVLPSRKSAEPFSSYKVIFQHPQAIRAIRHIRIARTPRLLSSCYQTGNPVLKKCVFSRFCSPSHPLFHYSHSSLWLWFRVIKCILDTLFVQIIHAFRAVHRFLTNFVAVL